MQISENLFGKCYHNKKAYIYNILYLFFKISSIIILILSCILLTTNSLLYLIPISFILWLISIKMKSIRNINNQASKIFSKMYNEEIFK